MKLLTMDMEDDEGTGVNISLRAQDAGHDVRYWTDNPHLAGKGMLEKPRDWRPSMQWADLVILTGNCDYPEGLDDCFGDYPIFGTNPKAAELELDRSIGQQVLENHGIETLPYEVVSSPEEGIDLIASEGKAYVLKPWGGDADKSMTCVADSPDDAIFTLQKWKKDGLFKGELMMQEKVDGVEIGVSAFFGPGGWSAAIEESFEHKKLMNDDLGGNTGEVGTVIRHVGESKLFTMLLEPLTDYLHLLKYVGDCSVNCIVDKEGRPLPLEFTMRLGWPSFNIRQEVIQGDPIEWMLDLLNGRDTLQVSPDIVVGVVMTHGDFPREDDDHKIWAGFPINGITPDNLKHLHFQQAMEGKTPRLIDGEIQEILATLTAGTYPLVVTGSGATVREAQKAAYNTAWEIKWPSNVMFRTDVGDRLRLELPKLQKHGFATDMEF